MSTNPKIAASTPIASTKASGKKSHACGPCRRLKRKCDLQVPCGTCQKGRINKIGECLASPATPLSDVQELIAPNSKFGRIQNQIPQVSSPRRSKGSLDSGSSNSSGSASKRQRLSANSPLTGSFNQFDLNESFNSYSPAPQRTGSLESNVSNHPLQQQQQQQLVQPFQRNSSLDNNAQPPPVPPPSQKQQQQLPPPTEQHQEVSQYQHENDPANAAAIAATAAKVVLQQQPPPPQIQPPLPPPPALHHQPQLQHLQHQHPHQSPLSIHHQSHHLPIQQPPLQQMQAQNLPQQQMQTAQNHQQIPVQYPYRTQSLDSSQYSQQLPFPPQLPPPPPPPPNGVYVDSNEFSRLRNQIDEQHRKLQSLERDNTQYRSKVNELENEVKLNEEEKSNSLNKNEYKHKYIKILPSKIQTKLLVDFYLQNLDYIYHPLHSPSFRRDLEDLWENPELVDIGWLGVLFMVLALAAIHLPKGLINIDSKEIERSHKIWFNASRECDSIAESLRENPKDFCLTTLQCFSLCQLYFYATRRAEELNEILEKAVKDALLMGLDEDDSENPDLLEVEMKRRLWWDICGCDTFRALSLGVKPAIRSYHSKVPYPSNCNDDDLTSVAVKIRSNGVPTDNSFNIYRAHMMKILNGIFEKDHHKVKKNLTKLKEIDNEILKGLLEIDIELCETSKSWFFQLDKDGNIPYVSDVRTHFQHHMLHTCICIHRFRIYQNYLSDDVPVAWEVAITSARNMFHVYRRLRAIYDLKNPLFLSQIHQAFTGSIIQSMLLLLNHKTSLSDQTALYHDVELMLSDLDILGKEVFILKPEVLKESFKVLNDLKKILNKNLLELEKDQKDIVSNVFGGKDMTENYLNKCTVSFIIDTRTPDEQQEQQEQQEQLEQLQAAYDYENQLGALVTDELLEKSVGKYDEIDNTKFNTYDNVNNIGGGDFQDRFRAAILPIRATNPPTDSDKFQPVSLQAIPNTGNVQENEESRFYSSNERSTQEHHIQHQHQHGNGSISNINNANGNAHGNPQDSLRNGNGTPFDVNFQDVDTFWNDIGQQGIDELSNMYYSEFSGYRVI